MYLFLRYSLALCGIVLFATPSLFAQQPSRLYQFQRLGLDDGLSQSSIFAIHQDRVGFLWFCTQDGLNRYDGYTFRIFRNNPDDSTSLALNWVNDVYEAPFSGHFWVITRSALNLYNPVNESFTPISLKSTNQTAKQANITISCLTEDAEQTLWIGTNTGLMRLSTQTASTSSPHTPRKNFVLEALSASDRQEHGFAGETVTALAIDSTRTLWVGSNHGLFFRQRGASHFVRLPTIGGIPLTAIHALRVIDSTLWIASDQGIGILSLTLSNTPLVKSEPYSSAAFMHWFHPEKDLPPPIRRNNSVVEIQKDSRGNIWLRMTSGLVMLMPQSATFRAFYQEALHNGEKLSSNTVSAIREDKRGRIWAATADGLTLINLTDNTTQIVRHSAHEPRSLSYNLLRCLFADARGTMWVGTDNGINSWNPARYKFPAFKSTINDTKDGNSNSARAFLADTHGHGSWQGGIWIGTDNGLSYYDSRKQTWKNFTAKDGLTNTDIRTLAKGKDGSLWLGTNGGGLLRFDEHNQGRNRVTSHTYKPNDGTSIASNRLRWLLVEPNGAMWSALYLTPSVSGTTGGVCYHPSPHNHAQQGWKRFQNQSDDTTSLSSNEVRFIYQDPADTSGNTFWIGTHTAGLERFDRASGIFTHFRHDTKDNNSLSSDIVTCILRTRNGELWVATASGINLFHPQTRTFTRFTVKHGLPNDFVYGMLEDNQGDLWMSSNNGLSRFYRASRRFENFDRFDGLPGNEFNSGAFLKLPSGEMLFGGLEGFTMFHPDSIHIDPEPPTIAITQISILNTPRYFQKSLSVLDSIALPYNENFVSFEFAALDFVNTPQNQYAYKMDGLDNEWIYPNGRRYAAYTDLQPGEYTFRVKAANSDGIWNKQGRVIRVVILPPFWATWWFRALMLCVGAVTLWLTHKWRLRVIEHRNRILKQLIAERTAELELRNSDLQIVNEQLEDYSDELDRFSAMLEEQAREVELVNTQLQEKNESLEILNRQKNEIIGVVAHDLKNPLSGILMTSSMLSRYYQRMKPEDIAQSIQRIQDTGERMHKIILDLLDVEAIEAGTFNLNMETINLTEQLAAMIDEYRATAQKKNITIHQPEWKLMFVNGDKRALRQVFDNLFSNALKYSFPDTCVWLEVHNTDTYFCISIRDKGPGLSTEDQAKLFQRFAKLTPRPTAGEHSTGLGLSIVKQLVEQMQGKITCQSEIGVGTTFSVYLPHTEGCSQ